MVRLSPKSVLETELAGLLRDRDNLNEELKQVYELIGHYQIALTLLEKEVENNGKTTS
jgi:hypothetical protein